MFTGISHHSVYVFDQDQALDFYCGTLGFEVSADGGEALIAVDEAKPEKKPAMASPQRAPRMRCERSTSAARQSAPV